MTFLAVLLAVATPSQEPEPIVIPPPAPVHGLVVDEDGRPVEGTELFLSGIPEDRQIIKRTSWTGRSDAQGRFVADRSRSWLAGVSLIAWTESIAAARPGSRPTMVKIERSGTSPANPLRIVLRPVVAAGVPLRVLDPDGKPVAGARILNRRGPIDLGLLPDILVDRLSVTTGTDGRANLSGISPEDLNGVTIESKEFGSQTLWVTDPKARGEQTLTLHAVGRLSGRVVVDGPGTADGLTVQGRIMAGPTYEESRLAGNFEVTTNVDGRFDVPALAEGWSSMLFTEGRANLIQVRSPAKRIEVVAGKSTEVEVVMKTGVPIRGVLRERGSRRPVVGATVRLNWPGGNTLAARTDRSGQFKGFLLPGDLVLSLGYAGSYVLVKEPPLKLGTLSADGGEFDAGVVEVVQGVNVRGVVRDASGKPIPGVQISGWRSSDARAAFGVLLSRSPAPVSDAQGEFAMENMVPGLSVELTARLGEAATASPTVVTPGETRDVTLVVSPANTVGLGGRVVDEYGKPIACAVVGIKSRWKTSTGAEVNDFPYSLYATSKIVTDAEGRFQIPKTLHRHAQHQAEATAPGRLRNTTEWFASTAHSFFDLTLFPTYPPEQAQIRADFDAGWAAEVKGDYAEAEARFKSALKGASERKIIDPLLLSWWHGGLAHVLIDRGDYAAGEKEARLALELSRKALPADHLDLARHLRVSAGVCMKQQKFDEAETLLGQASAILERRIGPDRPALARVVVDGKGSFILKPPIGPDRPDLGPPSNLPPTPSPPTPATPDHPEVGRLLLDLGYLEIARDRNAEAVPLLERACRVLETPFGPDSPELIPVLINLGHALSELERLGEAEPVFRRALKLAEKIDGPVEPRTVDVRERLVHVLRKAGKDAEADELEARPRPPRDR